LAVAVAWSAAGAVVGAGLALVYLRRYQRRGWRSTGGVLLVVLLLGLVARLAPSVADARAAGFGFLGGSVAAAAGWGLVRARRKARPGGPTARPGAGAGG
jgi:hypothetical protein